MLVEKRRLMCSSSTTFVQWVGIWLWNMPKYWPFSGSTIAKIVIFWWFFWLVFFKNCHDFKSHNFGHLLDSKNCPMCIVDLSYGGNKAMKGERERSVKVDLEVIDETFATHHDNNDDHRNWFLFPWLASRPNLMKILRARDICQLNFQKRQKEQQTTSI